MTFPPDITEKVARANSKAAMIWDIGRSGVMAMNPDRIEEMFEAFWKSDKPIDVERREMDRYQAQASLRAFAALNWSPASAAVNIETERMPTMDEALRFMRSNPQTSWEMIVGTLREEVKEAREDYFRRHNDAANAFEEIAVLQSHLAEARAVDEDGDVRTAADIQELLYGRDSFIVAKGLWSEFVDTLPRKVVRFQSQLTEARNSGLESAAEIADAHAKELDCEWNVKIGARDYLVETATDISAAIRSLKSQEKKEE